MIGLQSKSMVNKMAYECPRCKTKQAPSAWSEPGQGTSTWCIAAMEDGSSCGYSTFTPEEEEKPDPYAFNERMYWRNKLGL